MPAGSPAPIRSHRLQAIGASEFPLLDHPERGGANPVAQPVQPRSRLPPPLVLAPLHSQSDCDRRRIRPVLQLGAVGWRHTILRGTSRLPRDAGRAHLLVRPATAEQVPRLVRGPDLGRACSLHGLPVGDHLPVRLFQRLLTVHLRFPSASDGEEAGETLDCAEWPTQKNPRRPDRQGQQSVDRAHALLFPAFAGTDDALSKFKKRI